MKKLTLALCTILISLSCHAKSKILLDANCKVTCAAITKLLEHSDSRYTHKGKVGEKVNYIDVIGKTRKEIEKGKYCKDVYMTNYEYPLEEGEKVTQVGEPDCIYFRHIKEAIPPKN